MYILNIHTLGYLVADLCTYFYFPFCPLTVLEHRMEVLFGVISAIIFLVATILFLLYLGQGRDKKGRFGPAENPSPSQEPFRQQGKYICVPVT